MEISADGSSKSKTKSKTKTKSVVNDINSDNISMSDLELLANKKKVTKPELLVSDIVSNIISDKNISDKKVSEKKSSRKPSVKKERNYTTTDSDTTLNTTAYQKEKQRKINKENKNEKIRFLKNDFLYKIAQLNQRGNVSQLKLDMNCSLEEIEKEYNRIKNNKQAEVMVGLCKKGLLLGVQGFEFLNNKFDPLGIDLDGWGESMSYSMENQDYDEVLRELYEKYKGKESWSPEARLVMLILGSAVMFSVTKKMSNMDMSSNSFLGNIMNKFMNAQPQSQKQPPPSQQHFSQQPPPQFQQPPPQFNQPQVPQFNQQQVPQFQVPQFQVPQFQVPQFHQQFQPQQFQQQQFQQERQESEDSDQLPSRLKGPNNAFDTPDTIDLTNIMRKMEQHRQVDNILEESEKPSEKVIKQKARGRPANKKKTTRGTVAV
jgi:hypothetical protein